MTISEVLDIAIIRQFKLEIEYIKYNSDESVRTISNLEYCNEYGEYGYHKDHIKAYCQLRNENRTFRISRISNIRVLSPEFGNNNWLIDKVINREKGISNYNTTRKNYSPRQQELNAKFKTSNYTPSPKNENSNGCYIATMVYGEYNDPRVIILRNYRDKSLSKYLLGRTFIKIYYYLSPRLVLILKNNTRANSILKFCLDNFIKILKAN